MIDLDTWSQYEGYITNFLVTALILYMVFIIYRLAKDSKAGKWGYFVLFLALGLGMVGFIAKTIIIEMIGGHS